MALHCVRNTVIEDYHAAGKLTDAEMKAFNKEVANKLYSFLLFLFDPQYATHRDKLLSWLYRPSAWDSPRLDPDFGFVPQTGWLDETGKTRTPETNAWGQRRAVEALLFR